MGERARELIARRPWITLCCGEQRRDDSDRNGSKDAEGFGQDREVTNVLLRTLDKARAFITSTLPASVTVIYA